MASYFDEHDCAPLGDNERPNEQLLLARLLLDSGIATAMGMSFDSAAAKLPPATSRIWLQNEFPKYCFNESNKKGYQCPICLKEFIASSDSTLAAIQLPGCKHSFHSECLRLWLERTSNCPLCRHELPTDDPDYEQFKQQKKREKLREQELADLHDSMYS